MTPSLAKTVLYSMNGKEHPAIITSVATGCVNLTVFVDGGGVELAKRVEQSEGDQPQDHHWRWPPDVEASKETA